MAQIELERLPIVCWGLPIPTNYYCGMINMENTAASSNHKLSVRCDSSGCLSTTHQSFTQLHRFSSIWCTSSYLCSNAGHTQQALYTVIYCIPLIVMVIQLCWRCKTKVCSISTIRQRLKLVIAAKRSDLNEITTTAQRLDKQRPLLEKAQLPPSSPTVQQTVVTIGVSQ